MDLVKSYSLRSFAWIMLFLLILLVVTDAIFYLGLTTISEKMAVLLKTDGLLPEVKLQIDSISQFLKNITYYFIPVTAFLFILIGSLLWLANRFSFLRLMKKIDQLSGKTKTGKKKAPAPKPKEKKSSNRRIYLHLLSVFQRDGRLIDFFSEDLSLYEDAQIGTAVRSIQENCKKTLEKYLSPKAIIDEPEGESITIDPGFDPESIKLTGNVTGDPPFKGVLRHKGWQVSKLELPKLSGKEDSKVIAPAEVEIE